MTINKLYTVCAFDKKDTHGIQFIYYKLFII